MISSLKNSMLRHVALVAFLVTSSLTSHAKPIEAIALVHYNNDAVMYGFDGKEPLHLFSKESLFPKASEYDKVGHVSLCNPITNEVNAPVFVNFEGDIFTYDRNTKALTTFKEQTLVSSFVTSFFATECSPKQPFLLGRSVTSTTIGGGIQFSKHLLFDLTSSTVKEFKIKGFDRDVRSQYLSWDTSGNLLVLTNHYKGIDDTHITLLRMTPEAIFNSGEFVEDFEVLWQTNFSNYSRVYLGSFYGFSDDSVLFTLELGFDNKLYYLNHQAPEQHLLPVPLPNNEVPATYSFEITGKHNGEDFITLNNFDEVEFETEQHTLDYFALNEKELTLATERLGHIKGDPTGIDPDPITSLSVQ